MKKNYNLIGYLLLVVLSIIGISLTSSMNMFYNFIIMPLIGAVCYMRGLKKWYLTPVWMFVLSYVWLIIIYAIDLKELSIDLFTYPIFFSLIYMVLTALGLVIGTLLKLAFQKDNNISKVWKVCGALAALLIIAFNLFTVNSFAGNPVSAMFATARIKSYVRQTYPDWDLKVTNASYNFKFGEYYSRVSSNSSIDTNFSIAVRNNRIDDRYVFDVENRFTTYTRLQAEFNNTIKDIINTEFPYQTSILFADFYKEDFSSLTLDMPLDIHNPPLPASLTIYIVSDDITNEFLRDRLLELSDIIASHKIPIEIYNVVIVEATEDGKERVPGGKSIHLYDFPAEYIHKTDLIDLIKEHQAAMDLDDKKRN